MTTIQPPSPEESARAAKTSLRDHLLTLRRRRTHAEVGAASRAIATHVLAAEEVRRAATLTCYVGVGDEPGTHAILDGLRSAGKHVLLPVVRRDLDLDWGRYGGEETLVPARMGLLEPPEPHLGLEAVATADVLLVPGLAVSATGDRMGRGGGCYDRVLSRVPVGTPIIALLFDEEVDQPVPVEPHDRRVTAVATPSGLRRFG